MTDETNSSDILSLDFVPTVRERYERWLPERLAEIPEGERDSFFSTLAEQIAERVQSLELSLRGPGPEDESFLARVGRFNTARLQAKEMALGELLPAPEDEPQELLPMDDLEIELVHCLDPEDQGYEVQMEYWRAHYRRKGNYRPPNA
jgi:hypothetical protein